MKMEPEKVTPITFKKNTKAKETTRAKDVQQKPELETVAPNLSSKSLLDPQSKENKVIPLVS